MFAVLKFIKRTRFFYTIKVEVVATKEGNYYKILARKPKTKRQKRKLKNVLINFNNKVVPPRNFRLEDLEVYPYPDTDFKKRWLLEIYLNYCKEKRPQTAAVYYCKNISNTYYFDLCKYVKQVCIIGGEIDYELCDQLLKSSGTPLVFLKELPHAATTLNIDGADEGDFNLNLFNNRYFDIPFIHKDFCELEPVTLLSAIYNEWGIDVLKTGASFLDNVNLK